MPLKIESIPGPCLTEKRVTGFTDEEANELNSMDVREAKAKIIEMLNVRNGNIGDCWAYGYGIYRFWMCGGTATFMIGASCD